MKAIDVDKCNELGITPDEALCLASFYYDNQISEATFHSLGLKGFLVYDGFKEGFPINGKITQNGIDIIESLFLNSEITETVVINNDEHDRFTVLADKLRELYPKGKKPGTNLQWRDSTIMICKRLKALIKKYEVKFTDEEAIEATKRYINSFHGNYQFMQTLRYFLWKDDKLTGNETSQFLAYLQNEDDGDNNPDWNTTLR